MSAEDLAIEVQDASGFAPVPAEHSIAAWAKLALAGSGRSGELTVRLVAASESAELNSRYRHKPGPTNVLSFPSDAQDIAGVELLPIGDLVICAEVVAREAQEQRKSPEAHWAHMVVHGTLHLLGFDHETEPEALVMEDRERQLLGQLGFADPYTA